MTDRERILGLIPHAGAMCLLDRIEEWSEERIVCTTRSHRDPDNPLCRDGPLAALHLAEYGAQAMAIHGGLLAEREGRRAAPGMLVSVRDLQLAVQQLQDQPAPLTISASRLVADSGSWMYAFEAEAGGRRIGSGRVAVIAIAAENSAASAPDGKP